VAGPQIDVLKQVVRELPDREDLDEVEEQLERGDLAPRAGRARNGDAHRGDPRRRDQGSRGAAGPRIAYTRAGFLLIAITPLRR
jgi:hypothetical protein